MIYKLRAVEGAGWLRSLDSAGPIITGDQLEAEQYPSTAEALAVLRRIPRDRVAMRVVECEAHPRKMRAG